MRISLVAARAALALMLIGCAAGEPGSVLPPGLGENAVATVAITPSALSVAAGGTSRLVATAHDSRGAAVTGRAVTWRTDRAGLTIIFCVG